VLFALRNGVASTLNHAGLPELRLAGLSDAAAGELVDASGSFESYREIIARGSLRGKIVLASACLSLSQLV
jgi:hypothetical protein